MRILLTRPEGRNEELARALREAGHEAECVPLIAVEPLGELLVSPLGPREQDPHGTSASSSWPSSTGSFPERRSTQLPSSAATSAVSVVPS